MTKSKAIILLGLLSLLLGGARQHFYPGAEVSPMDLWAMPVFVLLIFWWFRLDTNQLNYKRTPWLNVSVVAVALLALPYYFFRSRGFKGGALATIAMLGVFIASNLLDLAGQHAVYGLES